MEEIDLVLEDTKERMEKTIQFFTKQKKLQILKKKYR